MRNTILCLTLGGVLLLSGGFGLIHRGGTSGSPRTVDLAGLAGDHGFKRNLLLTGGNPRFPQALTVWKTSFGSQVLGSEVYYVPLQPAAVTAQGGVPPAVMLIRADKMAILRQSPHFDSQVIPCTRLTRWDVGSKARDLLSAHYGEPAARSIVVLEYQRAPSSLAIPAIVLGLGIAVLCVPLVFYVREKTASPFRARPFRVGF